MRAAIVSDIHGNRHAFEAVLAAIDAARVDAVWCLGDLVGYGAEPDACVALAREHATIHLAGNHDLGVTGGISIADFSHGAAVAARWTRQNMAPTARDWLATLPSSAEAEGIGLFHASPRDPVWEYVLDTLTAELCFDADPPRVSLVGHSHVALAFHRLPGEEATGAQSPDGLTVDLADGEWLLNPGSVGQPRDTDPRAAWLELDTDARTATWHRVDYDIEGAAAAIRGAGLPASLAERLAEGR